jgi:S1-C subfamily serine protease
VLVVSIVSLIISVSVNALTARQIAQKTFPSVVLLVMEDAKGQPLTLGSGFFVKNDIIATNLHVIEGASSGYAKIVGKKEKYNISGIIGIDNKLDLALLKIKGVKAPILKLLGTKNIAVGDEVYVVGNPLGLEGTFSKGIISGVRQINSDTILQITAPISPGSSGGPVLNTEGVVIGVAIATFKGGQNLNFAIPVSYLKYLLLDLKSIKPLSEKIKTNKERSALYGIGGRSLKAGIVGIRTLWDSDYSTEYSFSLKNQMEVSAKDIICLVIFYDHDGEPVDFQEVKFHGIIPAGLAKRVLYFDNSSSIRYKDRLSTPLSVKKITKSVEIRVFDYQIVE